MIFREKKNPKPHNSERKVIKKKAPRVKIT